MAKAELIILIIFGLAAAVGADILAAQGVGAQAAATAVVAGLLISQQELLLRPRPLAVAQQPGPPALAALAESKLHLTHKVYNYERKSTITRRMQNCIISSRKR